MGENTKIEWATHTFNPWVGCQKVSPGCDNCYAEAMMDKRLGKVEWGPHGERKRTSEANWKLPLRWNRQAWANNTRYRVFCASLADWLDNQVPQQWREDLAELIEITPRLDWLLLTKRIENWDKQSPWRGGDVPRNVWIGVTAEDQEHYDRRVRILMSIPAQVHFLSVEPMLGPIAIGEDDWVDWIICGGESGPGARLMNPEWARALQHDCELAGISFFMKQMTGKQPIPDYLMVREFPYVAA